MRDKTEPKNSSLRRDRILEALEKSGFVKVSDLCSNLNTSAVTIRKDLEYLESQGHLIRVHGGAKLISLPSAIKRTTTKELEKKAIAKAAASMVKDGDFIIINVGTTCYYVCEALKGKKNLTVVTNSVAIVNIFMNTPSITVILLGGILNRDMEITVGEDVIEQLGKYTADKLFLGMDGVDAEMGATTYNHVEDTLMRQMMLRSKKRILVVDDSKIGKVTFARVANLSDIDTIITNYNEDNIEEIEKISALGPKIIYADPIVLAT